MNKQDFKNELNILIGDYNTNYFKYLLYSYNLSLNEGKLIIEDISNNFKGEDVNLIQLIEDSFQQKIVDLEKKDKINYLNQLMSNDNEFHVTYLNNYKLSNKFIQLIHDKIENEIYENNIEYFIIKRNLIDYFYNKKFYHQNMNKLKIIKGRDYNSPVIRLALKKYNNMSIDDIKEIILIMENEILDGETYNNDFRKAFDYKLLRKSEKKKAEAREAFNYFLDDGDFFKILLEKNNLTWDDGKIIIDEIYESIYSGELQKEKISSGFVLNYIRNWK